MRLLYKYFEVYSFDYKQLCYGNKQVSEDEEENILSDKFHFTINVSI